MYGRKNTKKMQEFNNLTEVLIFQHRPTAWLFFTQVQKLGIIFFISYLLISSTFLNAEQFICLYIS